MTELRLAVIGNPVEHSRSPEIFRQFANELDINIDYQKLLAESDSFEQQVNQFFEQGGQGLNVTVPFKEQAYALCAASSDSGALGAEASAAEAVNTLSRNASGTLQGNNSDGIGLLRDLHRLSLKVADARVLILGAGGAARGIIKPLLDAGPAELTVSNRSPWKPEALAERFATDGPIRPCTHIALKGLHFDLIINATSAGHQGVMPRLPDDVLTPGGIAYDLSYGDAAAPFLTWATQHGASQAIDGLGMLVAQAAESCRIWTGQRPSVDPVLDHLRALITD